MSSKDKTEIVTPNISVGGFNTFLPVLEEYLLFKEFFRKSNIWNQTKKAYWIHEKAILAWAYSEKHKHLGNPIDVKRIKEMYGFEFIRKENYKKGVDSVKEVTETKRNEGKIIFEKTDKTDKDKIVHFVGPYKGKEGYCALHERCTRELFDDHYYPFETSSDLIKKDIRHELPVKNANELIDSMLLTYGDMVDRKSTRLNSSHLRRSRMPSSA